MKNRVQGRLGAQVTWLVSSWTRTRIPGPVPQVWEASFLAHFGSTPVIENTCLLTVYFSKTVPPCSWSHRCRAEVGKERHPGLRFGRNHCRPCQPCSRGLANQSSAQRWWVLRWRGCASASCAAYVLFLNGSPQLFLEKVTVIFSQVYPVFWAISKDFKFGDLKCASFNCPRCFDCSRLLMWLGRESWGHLPPLRFLPKISSHAHSHVSGPPWLWCQPQARSQWEPCPYGRVPCSGNVFGPEPQFLPDNCVAFAVDSEHSSLSEGAQPSVSASQDFPGSHMVNMSHSLFYPLIRK